jgi:hypothetical protein
MPLPGQPADTQPTPRPKARGKSFVFRRMPQSKTALLQTTQMQQLATVPYPGGGGLLNGGSAMPVQAREREPRISSYPGNRPCVKVQRMGLGVEDGFVQIDAVGVGEKQVEVFESFGEEETLHVVALGLRFDAGERGEC